MKGKRFLLISSALYFLINSCSVKMPSSAVSPSDVVKTFYNSFANKNSSNFLDCLTPDDKKAIIDTFGENGATLFINIFMGAFSLISQDGLANLKNVKVLSEEIDGNNAVVKVAIDGVPPLNLVKVKNEWKISLGISNSLNIFNLLTSSTGKNNLNNVLRKQILDDIQINPHFSNIPSVAPNQRYIVDTRDGGKLNVRTFPSLDSDIIDVLENFSEVYMIKEEERNVNINGVNGKWTFIVSNNNMHGWVFGGYLASIDSGTIRTPTVIMPTNTSTQTLFPPATIESTEHRCDWCGTTRCTKFQDDYEKARANYIATHSTLPLDLVLPGGQTVAERFGLSSVDEDE
jgi:hypothetical protein